MTVHTHYLIDNSIIWVIINKYLMPLKSEIEINSAQEAVNNTRSRKTEYRAPVAET